MNNPPTQLVGALLLVARERLRGALPTTSSPKREVRPTADGSAPQAYSLLEGLSDGDLRALPTVDLQKGSIIVAEDESPGVMYVLLSGAAEAIVKDRRGGEHVVGTIAAGETVGEMSLLTGSPAVATVRATERTRALVLRADDLAALARSRPVVFDCLLSILAHRVAATNRLAVGDSPGRLIVLQDRGAPTVLAYAIACSIAWHTQAPTLLLGLDDTVESMEAGVLDAGVWGTKQAAEGAATVTRTAIRNEQLAEALKRGRDRFENVILVAPGDSIPDADRVVVIGRPGTVTGGSLRVEAWSEEPILVPARDGIVRVPALTAGDERSLTKQILPLDTDAGAALGWLARELTGLRVGVALGAGSLRGYAHLGALRAMERNKIPIDCLAGTSIGAIVAALYAHFGDVEHVTNVLDDLSRYVFRPTLPRRSLMSTRSLRRFVRKNLGDRDIEDLPIPLAIVTADLLGGEEVVLQRGSISRALFAAMALPGIYPPVALAGRILVDGGLLDPLPTGVVSRMGAGVVLGVKLSGGAGTVCMDEHSVEHKARIPSVLATILHSIELVQARVARDTDQTPSVVVSPHLSTPTTGKLRHFKAGRTYIEAGEQAVDEALPRLATSLPWLRKQ